VDRDERRRDPTLLRHGHLNECATLFAAASEMSHWNYRVVAKDDQFAIHEVFYDDAGDVAGCTEDPVFPHGETVEELRDAITRYGEAIDKPPLLFTDIEGHRCHRT
jgi:hypothetical protein